jgi:pimeloyl-ACP methyl ester carboxylesterase
MIKQDRLPGSLRQCIWQAVILGFLTAGGCTSPSKAPLPVTEYREPFIEKCQQDSFNRYHMLVPEGTVPAQKLPLVVVLDAHGNGQMAVNKFRPAVRYFPCLVAGSDLIKNNYPGFEDAIAEMITDIEKKFPVDEQQIILAGFSGGARMAYYYALHHRMAGLLMCGAGPGQQMPSCPVYTLSGMGDFNFDEQYRRPEIGSLSNDRYTSDYFHGIHEWPGPGQLSDALLVLLDNDPATERIRKKRSYQLLHVADSLERKGDELMAWNALENAAKLSVSNKEEKEAISQGEKLLKSEDFRKTIQLLETDLKTEAKLKQAYMQRSLSEGFPWWKNELTVLNKNLGTNNAGLKGDHFLRIKGFIGILLYSRINHMIHNDPNNPQLGVLLNVYAYAEPKNPDVWYFKALFAYQSGDRQTCVEDLNRSLKLGFTDREKMKKDFPAGILFQVIGDPPSL